VEEVDFNLVALAVSGRVKATMMRRMGNFAVVWLPTRGEVMGSVPLVDVPCRPLRPRRGEVVAGRLQSDLPRVAVKGAETSFGNAPSTFVVKAEIGDGPGTPVRDEIFSWFPAA
jgi:hypothetical protein